MPSLSPVHRIVKKECVSMMPTHSAGSANPDIYGKMTNAPLSGQCISQATNESVWCAALITIKTNILHATPAAIMPPFALTP